MAIHLSGLPGGGAPNGAPDGPSVPLFDLAPGGVYRADRVTPAAGALLPHRFTLTCAPPGGRAIGGLFSVALSCRSPRLAVSQHPALWSPDLPRPVPDRRGHPRRDGPRPPGRLTVPPSSHSPAGAAPADTRSSACHGAPVPGHRVVLTWRRVPRITCQTPAGRTTAGPRRAVHHRALPPGRPGPRGRVPRGGLGHRGDPLDQGPAQGPLLHRPGRPDPRPRTAGPRPSTSSAGRPVAQRPVHPRPPGHHPRRRHGGPGAGRGPVLQGPGHRRLHPVRARHRRPARARWPPSGPG